MTKGRRETKERQSTGTKHNRMLKKRPFMRLKSLTTKTKIDNKKKKTQGCFAT